MTELLALPAWNIPETPIASWVEQLRAQGLDVVLSRESPGVSWLEIAALGLRGYAVTDGLMVEAINFELAAPDPAPARQALESAALSLDWELSEDDEDNDDSD